MNSVRKKALIALIIEFFVFSFIGFSLVVIMFHAGILALPVIAFMWTFWGFNLLMLIVGIRVKWRFKISYAVLNFLSIALLFVFLINVVEPEKNITAFIVAIAVSVVVAFLYLLVSIFFIKDYWKSAKIEVQRLLGKSV